MANLESEKQKQNKKLAATRIVAAIVLSLVVTNSKNYNRQ